MNIPSAPAQPASLAGPATGGAGGEFRLPAPGVMVHLSPPLNPPILKGIKVHLDNPFRFDFILDKGDSQNSSVIASEAKQSQQEQLKQESIRLIKYFLASLTIPEKDLWVNLSPYEKDRIIPQSFGLTEMGRDLLAEDYLLKQITASLIYPESRIGKEFWKKVYAKAQKEYGTTNIPINTFNKVWVVPEKAVVYENAKAGTAYVVQAKLKVMLQQDYLSLKEHEGLTGSVSARGQQTNQIGSQMVRQIVLPELEKEVNYDKNFTPLRQVYNSLILATWYKKKIKDSILSQVYENKNKIAGVRISDPKEKERIYQRYLKAFKEGIYNYIKEEIDPVTQASIPRKYFSGGVTFLVSPVIAVIGQITSGQMKGDFAQLTVDFKAMGDQADEYGQIFRTWMDELFAKVPINGRNHIFLIGGPSGSGKTTIAEQFKKFLEEHGHPTVVIHRADFKNTPTSKSWSVVKDPQAVFLLVPWMMKGSVRQKLERINRSSINIEQRDSFVQQMGTLKTLLPGQSFHIHLGNRDIDVAPGSVVIIEGIFSRSLFSELSPDLSVNFRIDSLLQHKRITERTSQKGNSYVLSLIIASILASRTYRELSASEEVEKYDYLLDIFADGAIKMSALAHRDNAQLANQKDKRFLLFRIRKVLHDLLGESFLRNRAINFLSQAILFRNPTAFQKKDFFVLRSNRVVSIHLDSLLERRTYFPLHKRVLNYQGPYLSLAYMEPGYQQPFHRHAVIPEYNFIIDDSTVRFIEGGKEKKIKVNAGSLVYIPHSTFHTIENSSSGLARNLTVKLNFDNRIFTENSVQDMDGPRVKILDGQYLKQEGSEIRSFYVPTEGKAAYEIEYIVLEPGAGIKIGPYRKQENGLAEAVVLFSPGHILADDGENSYVLNDGDNLLIYHNRGYQLTNKGSQKAVLYKLHIITASEIIRSNEIISEGMPFLFNQTTSTSELGLRSFQQLERTEDNSQWVGKRPGDREMKSTGGIDLTPANMKLRTQNAGEGIKFYLDHAQLQQLQNAPGFVPVIINIQPMRDIKAFLGLNNNKPTDEIARL